MNQEQFRITELVTRFLTDELSNDELAELERFRERYASLDKWLDEKDLRLSEIAQRMPIYDEVSKESQWSLILEKQQAKKKGIKFFSHRWWAIAASIVLIGSFSTFVFINNADKHEKKQLAKEIRPIVPGEDKAILTLSDGRIVDLTNIAADSLTDGDIKLTLNGAALDYQKMHNVSDEHHQLKVPVGGSFKLILADGTKVWLNSDSELDFPAAFPGNERKVRMKGEAYFEIAKDKSKPFRVEVEGTQVEALGTAFNINTHLYKDRIKTILTEGKIKVRSNGNVQEVVPGYSVITGNGQIVMKEADTEEALAWKDGYFYFDSKGLKEVLEEVARWYDVDLKIQSTLTNKRFKGGIKKSASIKMVCSVLSDLTGYQIEIKDRTLLIK